MEPPKSASLIDLMKPEDQAKLAAIEQSKSELITKEWMGIAELGYYYGWQAIQDVIKDVITLSQARLLIEGARKVHSGQVYDQAVAGLAANAAKKGSFDKIMKHYITDMRTVQ